MKKLLVLVVLLVFAFSFSACTYRLVDFTVISSKNTAVKGKVGKRVKGSDGRCVFGGPPNMKEAIDRAIQQQPGADALIDGVLYMKVYPYYQVYEIEGTAINTKAR
ncbi:MAG: hypothetical protein MUC76_01175 [Spirochaetes bacterium]|nr:hypothetical protein [Spirochaetota bacterium]